MFERRSHCAVQRAIPRLSELEAICTYIRLIIPGTPSIAAVLC